MKTNFLKYFGLVAIVVIVGLSWSCTKENASVPSVPPQQLQSAQNASQADQLVAANVTPGIYEIAKFIDTGDDITTDYNGYSFNFKAGGVLVATTPTNATFNGTWKLNSAQTKMAINIRGTKALRNLSDDSWNVANITGQHINLRKPGPDKVNFVMQ